MIRVSIKYYLRRLLQLENTFLYVLTLPKVERESSIIFPAVILTTMLDLKMIKTRPRAVFPGNKYQFVMQAVSPTWPHCYIMIKSDNTLAAIPRFDKTHIAKLTINRSYSFFINSKIKLIFSINSAITVTCSERISPM